jgi:hypothetical protein
MSREYQALIGRIKSVLMDLDRVTSRAELLSEKARQSGDDG